MLQLRQVLNFDDARLGRGLEPGPYLVFRQGLGLYSPHVLWIGLGSAETDQVDGEPVPARWKTHRAYSLVIGQAETRMCRFCTHWRAFGDQLAGNCVQPMVRGRRPSAVGAAPDCDCPTCSGIVTGAGFGCNLFHRRSEPKL